MDKTTLIREIPWSTRRIRWALCKELGENATVSDFLMMETKLDRVPNLGKKSITEIHQVLGLPHPDYARDEAYIQKLESALRQEEQTLLHQGNTIAANAIRTYLGHANKDSMLRFYAILRSGQP